VVLLLAVWTRSWPIKVPAVNPPPGRFATLIPTVIVEGAVPLVALGFSQFPPSEVLVARLQPSVPDPPLRTCISWLVIEVPAVFREKLIWPGRLSRNAPAPTTVKVTGIVIDVAPPWEVTTICPE